MMWMALPFVAGAAIDLLYSGIGCFAACVISVSYTHLDVYKRQVKHQDKAYGRFPHLNDWYR